MWLWAKSSGFKVSQIHRELLSTVFTIRAVTSQDAMTTDWAQLPHSLLSKM
ncbi:MAG: hypothetical protein ACOYWZ_06685 [Bacillota bacterium]